MNSSFVTPALGTLWAHCVNTRLVLESFGQYRRMTIAKSPVSPVVSFLYTITSAGIEVIGDNENEMVQFNPENFWELKIIGRFEKFQIIFIFLYILW